MSHRHNGCSALVRLLAVLTVVLSMAGFAASHDAARAASSGGYTPVAPQRLASAVSVAAGHYTTVQVVGTAGVPSSNVAAVNVTVTGAGNATSFLTAYADTGGTPPLVTTVSLTANQTTADSAIVAPGLDGKIAIYNNAGAATVYVDLYGYYQSGSGAGFKPLSPSVRFAGPVTVNGGSPAVIQVGGRNGLPSSGGVIAATLTGSNDTKGGYLVCYGDGTPRPSTSNVNLTVGVASSVLVQCPVGANGKVDIYSAVGTVSVDLDVSGYYSGQSGGVAYNAVNPRRVLSAASLSSSSTLNVTVVGSDLPTTAQAVVADVTVAGCTQHGYVEAWAAGSARPNPDTSIVNDQLANAVTDLATLPVGAGGQVTFRLGTGAPGTCKLYVDVDGYFGAVDSGNLPGSVADAPPGVNGYDTNVPVSASAAQSAYNSGSRFVVRYVTEEHAYEDSADLTQAEATDILNAGLALMVVQHYPGDGWHPNGSLGTEYAQNSVTNAHTVGLPSGLLIWLDLEGVAQNNSASDTIAYCNNWAATISQAGYVPGVYIGANTGLSGDQIGALNFTHYWKSGSTVPHAGMRGYQMIQTIGSRDTDVTQNDNDGGSAIWLHP